MSVHAPPVIFLYDVFHRGGFDAKQEHCNMLEDIDSGRWTRSAQTTSGRSILHFWRSVGHLIGNQDRRAFLRRVPGSFPRVGECRHVSVCVENHGLGAFSHSVLLHALPSYHDMRAV